MKLKDIKPNPNNPRVLRDEKFAKLKQSIQEFPKMLSLRPIVIDENNVVLGGNMRLRALQDLGYTDIDDTCVKYAKDLTEEEKQRFIIADNVAFGEWDWDTLANDWEVEDLEAWGLEIPQFDTVEEQEMEDLSDKIKSMFKIEVICKDCHRNHHKLNGDLKTWREKSSGNTLTIEWSEIVNIKVGNALVGKITLANKVASVHLYID